MYYDPDGYAVNGIGICTKTDQTDVNPFADEKSIDRIWSEDGTRSIRFGNHEMDGMGTRNFHYHKETWYDDYVYNEVQRIQQK